MQMGLGGVQTYGNSSLTSRCLFCQTLLSMPITYPPITASITFFKGFCELLVFLYEGVVDKVFWLDPVSLYLHFATSVIHEITAALGIYCFR